MAARRKTAWTVSRGACGLQERCKKSYRPTLPTMEIGQIGVWTSFRPFGSERAGEAAKLVEQFGYGASWVAGSPHRGSPPPVAR